jgi:hypothetical protein
LGLVATREEKRNDALAMQFLEKYKTQILSLLDAWKAYTPPGSELRINNAVFD